MGASNVKWVRLGDYIEQCDERNSASINYPVIGINRDKTFMPTVANLDGVDIAKYKIVTKGMFVFSGMQKVAAWAENMYKMEEQEVNYHQLLDDYRDMTNG